MAPDIDNPDFKDDPKLYLLKDLKYIGFELWQVRPTCWPVAPANAADVPLPLVQHAYGQMLGCQA